MRLFSPWRYVTGRCVLAAGIVIGMFSAGAQAQNQGNQPWPADVHGHEAVQPGEHPRLFFRKADLPALREKAQTPEGKYIIEQLKIQLNGENGLTMPEKMNPNRGRQPDGSNSPVASAKVGEAFTNYHAAGYGFLYQLTGEKRYADLGRQCIELMLDGQRDRDNRYSFRNPVGALRAGPSVSAMAMAYDLLYDGLDPDFRQKVAQAMLDYNEGRNMSLPELVNGRRHGPHSNHFGPQVGAGLALLAVLGDPGVDDAKVQELIQQNMRAVIRAVTEGSGDGGMFWEGKGPGGINTDTSLVPLVQAYYVAMGKDFIQPRPNYPAVNIIKMHELMISNGKPIYIIPSRHRSSYGTGDFTARGDRGGLSRGGQFAQGFGIMPDKLKPAMLWVYNNVVEKDPKNRTFDTVGHNPHRPMLSLINWPIDMQELNPAEVLPKVHIDNERGYLAFRNQWTGTEDDIVVNAIFGARDPHALCIYGKGQQLEPMGLPNRSRINHLFAAEDGSGTVTSRNIAIGVDFSRTSGADCLVVIVGGNASDAQSVQAGGKNFQVITLGGANVQLRADGDAVIAGEQRITHDGEKIVFSQIAPATKLPRMGLWSW